MGHHHIAACTPPTNFCTQPPARFTTDLQIMITFAKSRLHVLNFLKLANRNTSDLHTTYVPKPTIDLLQPLSWSLT